MQTVHAGAVSHAEPTEYVFPAEVASGEPEAD